MTELIYHYTSLEAFKNIIETKHFWATNIFYTNDFMEMNLGINRHQFAINNSRLENIDKLNEEFLLLLEPYRLPKKEIYFLSFSKNRNDLSQWRAYAPKGVCIGINPIIFEKETAPSDCIYDNEEQLKKLQEIVSVYSKFIANPEQFDNLDEFAEYKYSKEALDLLKKVVLEKIPHHCEKYGLPRIVNLYNKIHSELEGFYTLAKNECFKVENETRYLYNPRNDQTEYKITNNLLSPYCKIEFDLNSVEEIWIDTNLDNFEIMEYSIRNFWGKVTNYKIKTPAITSAHLSLR